jgi:hypothetical protein
MFKTSTVNPTEEGKQIISKFDFIELIYNDNGTKKYEEFNQYKYFTDYIIHIKNISVNGLHHYKWIQNQVRVALHDLADYIDDKYDDNLCFFYRLGVKGVWVGFSRNRDIINQNFRRKKQHLDNMQNKVKRLENLTNDQLKMIEFKEAKKNLKNKKDFE